MVSEEFRKKSIPSNILEDTDIPAPPERWEELPAHYDYSQEEIAALHKLRGDIIEAAASGREIIMIFDYDGTLSPFHPDPLRAVIHDGCKTALMRLSALNGIRIAILTGRKADVAADFLQDEAGRLGFEITGGHGVEHMFKDRKIVRYEFGEKERAFITKFHEFGKSLEDKYPGVIVERKHGALGVNVNLVGDDIRRQAYAEAKKVMEDMVESEDNPSLDSGMKMFSLKSESDNELEIRSLGKDFGIEYFIKPSEGALVIFAGDSLNGHGTDIPAAAMVNEKYNGRVLMVLNGRSKIPEPGEKQCPAAVFANQKVLAKFLDWVADGMERVRLSASPEKGKISAPSPSEP